MVNADELRDIIGRYAIDREGDQLGRIGQIYLDDASGAPQWLTISTGLFGTKESFAPISGYCLVGDDVVLNVTRDQIKGAPNPAADGHLDDADNDRLSAYYDGSLGNASDDTTDPVDPSPGSNAQGAVDADGSTTARIKRSAVLAVRGGGDRAGRKAPPVLDRARSHRVQIGATLVAAAAALLAMRPHRRGDPVIDESLVDLDR